MNELAARFRDPGEFVVLEGFHALKHAVRFGATLSSVVCTGSSAFDLASSLAPEVLPFLEAATRVGSLSEFSPRSIPTGVIALAARPTWSVPLRSGTRPVVLLEDPRHLGNVGACIRVAAAVDIDGLVVTGNADPWHPECVRGAAGLQFALPIARVSLPLETSRPVIAFDPTGAPLGAASSRAATTRRAAFADDAILAFGTERDGLSDDLLARADEVVSLPMRSGVSSLNLATSVAVALYSWRLNR